MTQVENRPNSFPCFSDEEYARRYRAVRQAMEQQDVDALLIFGVRGSSEVQDLSNYLAQSPCWLLVPRDGEATCFTHFFNHQPCAKAQSILSDVRWYGPSPIPMLAEEIQRKALAKCRLGLVTMRSMPYGHVRTQTSSFGS